MRMESSFGNFDDNREKENTLSPKDKPLNSRKSVKETNVDNTLDVNIIKMSYS